MKGDEEHAEDRSPEARLKRKHHLFLSHSSKDKSLVRRLAEDLNRCGVDAWLDEWELQVGDSLQQTIAQAMEQSRYVAVLISKHFLDSDWANSELRQAIARAKREKRTVVLPLLCDDSQVPAFVEDRIYLDFRDRYYHALVRLSGMIHELSRPRVEDAVTRIDPDSLEDSLRALRYSGHEPYGIVDAQDFQEISNAGGEVHGETVRFYPEEILQSPVVSERVRNLMRKIIEGQ